MSDAVDSPELPVEAKPAGPIPVEIIKVILKIQKDLAPLAKSADNTEYGSKFTPLPEVMTVALKMLNKHGIIVTQSPTLTDEGQSAFSTTLAHKSGGIYREVTKLAIEKINPQSHASAITYMRRYQLMAMLGITSEDDDDDGNKAAGVFAKVTDEQVDRIKALCLAMSYPPEEVAKKLWNVKTSDHAKLTIIKLEEMVAERARDIEARDTALEFEQDTDIEVTTERSIKQRLDDLAERDGILPKKLIFGLTEKPFLSKCDDADLSVLAKTLESIEAGTRVLPDEWYAAGHPPTRPTADEGVKS